MQQTTVTGRQGRDAALDLLEKHRADYLARARAWGDAQPEGARATVDDVRAACPPPAGIDGRVMGVVFRGGEWRPVDYVNSTRAECHHRPIRVFQKGAANG